MKSRRFIGFTPVGCPEGVRTGSILADLAVETIPSSARDKKKVEEKFYYDITSHEYSASMRRDASTAPT
jgi:hypothetical protein